jgi:hypothetical protein
MTDAKRAGLFCLSLDGRGRGEGGEGIMASIPISIFELHPLPIDGEGPGRE